MLGENWCLRPWTCACTLWMATWKIILNIKFIANDQYLGRFTLTLITFDWVCDDFDFGGKELRTRLQQRLSLTTKQ